MDMSKRESEEEAIARVLAARKEKPLKGDFRKLLGLCSKSMKNK